MRLSLTMIGGLAVLLTSAPAFAQTFISTHPPLSPAEAVAVLRASHSAADWTDYRGVAPPGPAIVVMGGSTTPWDWPTPRDSIVSTQSGLPFFVPYGFGGQNRAEFSTGPRSRHDIVGDGSRVHHKSSSDLKAPVRSESDHPERPTALPARHLRMEPPRAGGVVVRP